MRKHPWTVSVGSGKSRRTFTITVILDEVGVTREFDRHDKAGDGQRIDEVRVVQNHTSVPAQRFGVA
jgi:hypothetical protein